MIGFKPHARLVLGGMVQTYLILCVTAFAAGVINSVAGGGTLLTYPALLVALGSTTEGTVIANATSTIALVPGSLSAVWAYRREVVTMRKWVAVLAGPSLLGGGVGSILLIAQPAKVFAELVPWLILAAALLFALQPQISRLFRLGQPHDAPTRRVLANIVAFQFLVSVYGGYFGAGAGILMLGALALMGFENIHQMNALKSSLGFLINIVAVGVFIAKGCIVWPYGIAMALSASLGGYCGASLARRMDKRLVRNGVALIGFALAGYYFYRQYG